ncbi:MAG: caspase family protein [Burkholderiaceae bacterium]
MNILLCFLVALMMGSAYAQSNLPACPSSGYFHNCFGTFTQSNGDKYVGEFKDDKFNGQGTYTWINGSKYVGEWKDDQRNGQGTFTFADGAKYVGELKDGNRNGQGTFTFADGSKYVGEFKDGNSNGQGTFTFADGSKYVGEFKDGKRNGQGTEYASNGSITTQGIWADGSFVRSAPVQQATAPNIENERLKAEADEAKRRQAELEEQLRIAQQQTSPVTQQTPVRRSINAHALVIGNAAYAGSGRLDNPVNDAHSITAKLRSMGFVVTEVVDANRARLVSSLAQFSRTAANAEMTLLFYSGHGVQIYGTNYVLPIDVDQTDLAQATLQGVSLNSVVEQFMPGKTKLVFLDACRTNPMARTASRGFTKGLAPINVAEGTLISYAAKDGQEALDGSGQRNSPFTTALLEHIGDPDDIAVVLRKVREKVMKTTNNKQQPWEYGSLTGGALVLSAIKAK